MFRWLAVRLTRLLTSLSRRRKAANPTVEPQPVILDYIDHLELSADDARLRFNELHSLAYLVEGLTFLAGQVAKIEARIKEQELKAIGPDKVAFSFGNRPGLDWVPQGLVASAFHWYSVSACSYARLVGFLGYGAPAEAQKYVETVMPQIYLWRNKVAAHFSLTDPRKEDTAADLAASVMFPVSIDDARFVVGAMQLGMKGTSSRDDMQWSLTKSFEDFKKRYQPPSDG